MVIPLALRTLIVMLASLACFFAKPVNAQDRAGTLQGVIKDIQGAPVTGAFVKMHNAERRLTFMVKRCSKIEFLFGAEAGFFCVNLLRWP